jgi:thiamine monophosphate kinase
LALHGGDDYELLFTVPRTKLQRVPRSFLGLPLTAIGDITAQRALILVGEDGRETPLPNRGWDPFRV